MPRRFGAVSAGGHVAPAAAAVLRAIEEDAGAARVGATSHARELAQDERIGGGFHDRDHQPRERIAGGDEAAHEGAIAARFEVAYARAASQHTIDLHDSV